MAKIIRLIIALNILLLFFVLFTEDIYSASDSKNNKNKNVKSKNYADYSRSIYGYQKDKNKIELLPSLLKEDSQDPKTQKGIFKKKIDGKIVKSIAVLKFNNRNPNDIKRYNKGSVFSLKIIQELNKLKMYNIIENEKIEAVISKQEQYSSDFYNKDNWVKIGKLIPAEIIISGEYFYKDSQLYLSIFVFDNRQQKVIWTYHFSDFEDVILEDKIKRILRKFIFIASEKPYGFVTINVSPYESAIFIPEIGNLNNPIVKEPLPIGKYKANIISKSYHPKELTFTVRKNDHNRINIDLEEIRVIEDKWTLGINVGLLNNKLDEGSSDNTNGFIGFISFEKSFFPFIAGINISYSYFTFYRDKSFSVPNSNVFENFDEEKISLMNYLLSIKYHPFTSFEFSDIISPYFGVGAGAAHHTKEDQDNKVYLSAEGIFGITLGIRNNFSLSIDLRYRYSGKIKYQYKEFNWLGNYRTIEDEVNISYFALSIGSYLNF